MSDQIKHECGIALIRLLKPLNYYQKKYGTALYGLNKLYLLMQKQRNRGQDGAGIATVKLDAKPGKRYISRRRSNETQPIRDIFDRIYSNFNGLPSERLKDSKWLKENLPYMGEVLMGHLRYGTHGGNLIEYCHPVMRQSNWVNRNLIMAGNFNLINVDELFRHLVKLGQSPKEKTDTITVLEKFGHFLDQEVESLFAYYKQKESSNKEVARLINEHIDVKNIIKRSIKKFDGGYAMAGIMGHGDAFAVRDPKGIRPVYYYHNDEIVVVASERPAIQTACDVLYGDVQELKPGKALIIKKNGKVSIERVSKKVPQQSCTFERIYFSRGTDKDIYTERKQLGSQLAETVLQTVDYDFDNTVFSFVPNTAEVAFYGMMEGVEDCLNSRKKEQILNLGKNPDPDELEKILSQRARMEKIAVKDLKLRTFIAEGATRDELVSHVYDVTYGIVRNEVDTLVLLDDSIVRGTTLRQSILKIVARLRPKKIVVVSSAPQIRYPDCYGIDMSRMQGFVAFKALVALLHESGQEHLLNETYKQCKAEMELPVEKMQNRVAALYDLFPYEEVSTKIAEIVSPKDIKPEVHVIYQSIEGLHQACTEHAGDWYFSGKYPTPGGNKVVNRAFMLFMEGKNERAY